MAGPTLSEDELFQQEVRATYTPENLKIAAQRLGEAVAGLDHDNVKTPLLADIKTFETKMDELHASTDPGRYAEALKESARLGIKSMMALGVENNLDQLSAVFGKKAKATPEAAAADQAAENLVERRVNALFYVGSEMAQGHGIADPKAIIEGVQAEMGIEDESPRVGEFRDNGADVSRPIPEAAPVAPAPANVPGLGGG